MNERAICWRTCSGPVEDDDLTAIAWQYHEFRARNPEPGTSAAGEA